MLPRYAVAPTCTMRLDGVYVDGEHCIVLVLPSVECDPDGKHIYRVYGTLPTNDNSSWSGVLVDRRVDDVPCVKWLMASDVTGCNPTDCNSRNGVAHMTPDAQLTSIAWAGEEKWTRVHLSALHCYLLTHRPYVPMTIVAMHLLREFAVAAYARMVSLVYGHDSKES